MRRHIAAWCIAALGLSSLAACAQPVGSVAAGSSAPASSPSSAPSAVPSQPSPAPSPSPVSSMTPPIIISPPAASASGGQVSVTGTIYSGAEPSCLLLKTASVEYLLLANDSMKLRAGERGVVTGHVEHGIMTHCQQGTPFEVTNFDKLTP